MVNIERKTTCFIITASSLFAVWRLLRLRAQRAKAEADTAAKMMSDGPMIDYNNQSLRLHIFDKALRRATKLMSLYQNTDAESMVGQVGGLSKHKRPILRLAPEFILKPINGDHRGIREVAFYEALKIASENDSSQTYAAWLEGKPTRKANHNNTVMRNKEIISRSRYIGNERRIFLFQVWDTLVGWLAVAMQDPDVVESEKSLCKSWKSLHQELEILRKIATFTSTYYGIVGQRTASMTVSIENKDEHSSCTVAPNGTTLDDHLLLQDVTSKFSKPCVIDIKMGTQTFEPDAPVDKKEREKLKFPQQTQFGFRIVGIRIYDPDHSKAEKETGFVHFTKEYGRSLATEDDVMNALRIYFSSGTTVAGRTMLNDKKDKVVTGNTSHQQYNGDNSDVVGEKNKKRSCLHRQQEIRTSIRTRFIADIIMQIRAMEKVFEKNKSLSFTSSSLLMVYEGDVLCQTSSDISKDATTVKLIDLGRVRRRTGVGDRGFRLGLRKLRHIMNRLREEELEVA